MCLVQSGVGGAVLLAMAYVCVCTGVHVCESAYVHMSVSSLYVVIFSRPRAMVYFA